MNRPILHLGLWLLLLMLPSLPGHSQTEPESSGPLMVVQQYDSTRSFAIDTGSRLRVRTFDGRLHKGLLTSVKDSSFFVGTTEVPMRNVNKLSYARGEGSRIAGLTGLVVGAIGFIFGLAISLLGYFAILGADNTANGCGEALGGFLLLLLGILLGGVGLVLLIIGLIAYAVGRAAGRSFLMGTKWRLRKP